MPKRDVERELEKISALRQTAGCAKDALSEALQDPVNLITARAAKVAADLQLIALGPELIRAYERLFTGGPKKDPQCAAKIAIAKALKELGWTEAAPFLRGVKHVQFEPVWGGQADSAAPLRATCVLALSQCTDIPHGEIVRHAVDAIADPFAVVRSDAVRALAHTGDHTCALLLRMKARLGDEDVRITGEALEASIALDGDAGVALAKEFLDHARDEVQDEAALALGASRHPAAIQALIERWQTVPHSHQSPVILRALGIAREEGANAVLLECLRKRGPEEAVAALDALAGQARNEEMRSLILGAVRERGDERLMRLAEERLAR